MKVKKRLFAGMLALAMLLSLNVTAFAEEPTYSDTDIVTVIKEYNAANTGTRSPQEDFEFVIAKESIKDQADGITLDNMPMPTVADASFDEGEATGTADIVIDLPDYTGVGIYTYKITEKAGTTAGVTYDSTPIYLVVTVIQQGDKLVRVAAVHEDAVDGEKLGENDSAFTNTYSAGSLTISKDVTGLFGDKGKYFEFTVTLTNESDKTAPAEYVVTTSNAPGKTGYTNPTTITAGTPTTFWLKDGESISIANLPYGVTYTVSENREDYTAAIKLNGSDADSVTNEEIDTETETAEFTNAKGGTVDTGVYLDNLPYIIVFAGVLAAVAVLVIRRRRVDD